MKKLLILLMAFSLVTACNNDKGKFDKKADYREKDDYGDNQEQSDDKSKKNENDNDNNKDFTSNGGGWSENEKSKFLSDCMEGFSNDQSTGKKVCSCVLGKIENKYSSLDEANAKGGEAEGRTMGIECVKEMGINKNTEEKENDDTNNDGGDYASGGWSSSEVKAFVTSCVREARKGGMEYLDAQSYCDCMQYKIAKIYPNAKDADRLTAADLATPAMKRMIKSCLSEH